MAKIGNRFIVLISKRPRGPLTVEEIRVLMEKGLVTYNDLAFLVPEPGVQQTQSDWKLLWQFPEFDRRTEDEKNGRSPSVEKERREPVSLAETEQKIKAELPSDLMNLTAADLIPKSTGPTQMEIQDLHQLEAEHNPRSPGKGLGRRIFLGGGIMASLVGVVAFFLGQGKELVRFPASPPSPVVEPTPMSSGDDGQDAMPLSRPSSRVLRSSPSPQSTPSQSAAASTPSAPEPRESGSGADNARDRDTGFIREESRTNDPEESDEDIADGRDEEGRGGEDPPPKARRPAKQKRLPERDGEPDRPGDEDAPPDPEEDVESLPRE